MSYCCLPVVAGHRGVNELLLSASGAALPWVRGVDGCLRSCAALGNLPRVAAAGCGVLVSGTQPGNSMWRSVHILSPCNTAPSCCVRQPRQRHGPPFHTHRCFTPCHTYTDAQVPAPARAPTLRTRPPCAHSLCGVDKVRRQLAQRHGHLLPPVHAAGLLLRGRCRRWLLRLLLLLDAPCVLLLLLLLEGVRVRCRGDCRMAGGGGGLQGRRQPAWLLLLLLLLLLLWVAGVLRAGPLGQGGCCSSASAGGLRWGHTPARGGGNLWMQAAGLLPFLA